MASKMPERRYFAQGKQEVLQEVRLFCGGVVGIFETGCSIHTDL
jgi:hypothetical protein